MFRKGKDFFFSTQSGEHGRDANRHALHALLVVGEQEGLLSSFSFSFSLFSERYVPILGPVRD